ncbi:MAG: alkaline phosphatase family protein [Candidatus Aminicenantes bacterium]|nr:alkaline phosphatase family protein [Candidatus Aminicenantes bacterium]
MKFLLVVLHALACGLFFCLLLALLVLNLNINVPFRLGLLLGIALFLSLSYGAAVTLAGVLVFYFVQFFSGRRSRLLFSPTFLTAGFSVLLLVFLALFWENYKYFLSFFDPATRLLLRGQILVFFGLSLAGLSLTYGFHYYKKKAAFFIAYAVLLAGALAYGIGQRAAYPRPEPRDRATTLEVKRPQKRVVLIGLDGLSLDFIIPSVPQGTLPNFGWLMDKGSWGRLESFSPTEPTVLRTSTATGKFPYQHRRISPSRYRLLFCPEEIEVVPRFMLFKQLTRTGLLTVVPAEPPAVVRDIWSIFDDNRISSFRGESRLQAAEAAPAAPSQAEAAPAPGKAIDVFFKGFETDRSPLFGIVRRAFALDAAAEEDAFAEKNRLQPRVYSLRLNGLNTVKTYFFKFSFPERYGSIAHEDITRFSSVIPRYYHYYDQLIGKYLAGLKDDDLLVVYSSHGMEPLPFWKRFVEWILGDPEVSADHENAPDGVIFLYGRGVRAGNTADRFRLVDLAPTLLYFMGLPVGRDMDGIVQSGIFSREFTSENPVFYISSYEDVALTSEGGAGRRP